MPHVFISEENWGRGGGTDREGGRGYLENQNLWHQMKHANLCFDRLKNLKANF